MAWNHVPGRRRLVGRRRGGRRPRTHPPGAEHALAYRANSPRRWSARCPGTVDLVRELHAAGVPMWGLTNWSARAVPARAGSGSPFLDLLDERRGLRHRGRRQAGRRHLPERRRPRRACRRRELVFVDDREAVAAAERLRSSTASSSPEPATAPRPGGAGAAGAARDAPPSAGPRSLTAVVSLGPARAGGPVRLAGRGRRPRRRLLRGRGRPGPPAGQHAEQPRLRGGRPGHRRPRRPTWRAGREHDGPAAGPGDGVRLHRRAPRPGQHGDARDRVVARRSPGHGEHVPGRGLRRGVRRAAPLAPVERRVRAGSTPASCSSACWPARSTASCRW